MDEVKALDKIQINFKDIDDVKIDINVDYLDREYPRETDILLSLYQANRIDEVEAHTVLLELMNGVIPDILRGA